MALDTAFMLPLKKIMHSSISHDTIDIDVIIKLIEEENNMITVIDKNKWEIPKYTGNQINKAGKIIADPFSTSEERDQALIVLNNWRAAHAYP